MFNNLTHLDYKRSKKEAFGFYLAYLFLIILVGATLGGLAVIMFGDAGPDFATRMGTFGAFVVCTVLSFLILKEKGLMKKFSSLIYIIISGTLSIIGGGLLGLIPVAYLTTIKGAKEKSKEIASADTKPLST